VEAKKQIQRLIKNIIEEAFNIDLINDDCRMPAEKIHQILYEK
jgi:hypothetical protein